MDAVSRFAQSGGQECPRSQDRLWQPEYWDTLIRSPAHFAACQSYIADNPRRARLAPAEYDLWLEE